MKAPGTVARAASWAAAVLLIAGCTTGSTLAPSASQAPGAVPQSRTSGARSPVRLSAAAMAARPSWLSPEAKTGPVIYVANAGNVTVSIFSGLAKVKSPPPIGIISQGVTNPVGLAVDSAANLYVVNAQSFSGPGYPANVTEYARGAKVPHLTYTSGLNNPVATAVGNDGTLYVANGYPPSVVEYPPGSTTPSITLTDLNANNLTSVAVDASGDVYVAYGPQNCCPEPSIDEFLAGQTTPDTLAIADGQYNAYGSIVLDASGNIVVSDGAQIAIYPPSADVWPSIDAPTQTFGLHGSPVALAPNKTGKQLFVVDSNNNEVLAYAYPAGRLVNLYANGVSQPQAVAARPAEPLPTRSPQPPPPTPSPTPSPSPTPPPVMTEYSVNNSSVDPAGITSGPDGALWFAGSRTNFGNIGQITTSGQVTLFGIPTNSAQTFAISAGPDGGIWFAESNSNNIGRIDPGTDQITEFPIPTGNADARGITGGPDGGVWFTEEGAHGGKIGRVDPTTDQISEYSIPSNNGALGITTGPDGALWFTEGAAIGRIDPTTQAITEYPVATGGDTLWGIATGSDGALWFTEEYRSKIGRIDPTSHVVTEFSTPTNNAQPIGIAAGSDGALWFCELNYNTANQIGRVDPATDQFNEFLIPTYQAEPFGITSGPDGAIWFTELNGEKIGKIVPNGPLRAKRPAHKPHGATVRRTHRT